MLETIYDWLGWFYGRYFVGHAYWGYAAALLSGTVICFLSLAIILGVLWPRAVDKIDKERSDQATRKSEHDEQTQNKVNSLEAENKQLTEDLKRTRGQLTEVVSHTRIEAHTSTEPRDQPVSTPTVNQTGPDNVASVNQQGGITAGTVNVNRTPRPKYRILLKKNNVPEGALYSTEFEIVMTTAVTLPNFIIRVESQKSTIESMLARDDRPISAFRIGGRGNTWTANNQYATSGTYVVSVLTKNVDDFKIFFVPEGDVTKE